MQNVESVGKNEKKKKQQKFSEKFSYRKRPKVSTQLRLHMRKSLYFSVFIPTRYFPCSNVLTYFSFAILTTHFSFFTFHNDQMELSNVMLRRCQSYAFLFNTQQNIAFLIGQWWIHKLVIECNRGYWAKYGSCYGNTVMVQLCWLHLSMVTRDVLNVLARAVAFAFIRLPIHFKYKPALPITTDEHEIQYIILSTKTTCSFAC